MHQSSANETQNSGYVFEVQEDTSISFRRADMANPDAKDALAAVLSVRFRLNFSGEDIDDALVASPKNCPYLCVRVVFAGKPYLRISRAKKEPGKYSGDNPVITGIRMLPIH